MRNEMIGAIVRRAIEHPEFRRALVENPKEALSEHGFVLEAEDFAEIEQVRQRLGDEGTMTDAKKALRSIAEEYGIEVRS